MASKNKKNHNLENDKKRAALLIIASILIFILPFFIVGTALNAWKYLTLFLEQHTPSDAGISFLFYIFVATELLLFNIALKWLESHVPWLKNADKIEAFLFMMGLIFLAVGNGFVLLYTLAIILFIRVLKAFIKSYNGLPEKEFNHILTGSGIFLFTIINFLLIVPMFADDGTALCNKPYPLTFDKENETFTADINDLHIRLEGERLGLVGIKTKFYDANGISCENCSIGPYPKPDGNKDPWERKIQYTNVKVTIPASQEGFSFAQQVSTADISIPFITETHNPARVCDCKINQTPDSNTLQCTKGQLKDFFLMTQFFTNS